MGITERRPRAVDLALLVSWALVIGLVRASRPDETDPYWQIRDGMELLDGRPLAAPDTWGWDPVEGNYYPNSPLWNVFLALAWRAAGFPGFVAVTVLVIVAYFLVAAWTASLAGARIVHVILAGLGIAVIALPAISPRATMVAEVLLLSAINVGVVLSRRLGRWRLGVALAAVLAAAAAFATVGGWLHLSWGTSAWLMVGAWLVTWLLTPGIGWRRSIGLAAAAAAGAVAGISAGPYGWGVRERSQAVLESTVGLITEWLPIWHPGQNPVWAVVAVLSLLMALVLAVHCVRRLVGARPMWDRLPILCSITVISLPMAVAGLWFLRFSMVALLTLYPACAAALTHLMDRQRDWARRSPGGFWRERAAFWSTDQPWRVVLTATLVLLAPLAIVYSVQMGRPTSEAALADLPSGCHLFTKSRESAAVILLRPDVPVWIDGRADYWGRDRISAYYDYTVVTDSSHLVPEGTTCVMLREGAVDEVTRPLAEALDASEEWRRDGGADGYVIWLPDDDASAASSRAVARS